MCIREVVVMEFKFSEYIYIDQAIILMLFILSLKTKINKA